MLKQDAKAPAHCPHESQSCVARAFRSFGRRQTSGEMRLIRRVSSHQRALLLRLSPADWAPHR